MAAQHDPYNTLRAPQRNINKHRQIHLKPEQLTP